MAGKSNGGTATPSTVVTGEGTLLPLVCTSSFPKGTLFGDSNLHSLGLAGLIALSHLFAPQRTVASLSLPDVDVVKQTICKC